MEVNITITNSTISLLPMEYNSIFHAHTLPNKMGNPMRTLLFHSHIPPTYWVKALNMATHLLNILPSTSIQNETPHFRLFKKHPTYTHLRIFGCLCFPHITTSHKLEPHTIPCVFLGYPTHHGGYRCLDLSSRCIIISRHLVFDKTIFPFGSVTPPSTSPSATTFTDYPSSVPSPTESFNTSIPSQPTHRMTTRARSGIIKPIDHLNLHTSSISPVPRSHLQAMQDPNWQKAMNEEYEALISNGTWTLVPRPLGVNVVRSMWLFRHKHHADGSLACYKARLVANGRNQQQCIDCDETFSPVVKPATIRIVRDPNFPDHAPRAWYHRFASCALQIGFQNSRSDSSLFIYHSQQTTAYLLLYVDDIILTASSSVREFSMMDLGALNYFLGISVVRSSTGLFLSQ
ncbi:hypothetical protein OSB04_016765 [Centaurea solstitialis]|uniref:Reverse transcriptase Ty1/copia-type domain-containing protein n=1 Tax=Centaurea solstitialis TaxID=347529 RepID=A0AA38T1L5_9ASTR|nr:hypothetical protein OSB04_016765 [Centaurea solstitialis]